MNDNLRALINALAFLQSCYCFHKDTVGITLLASTGKIDSSHTMCGMYILCIYYVFENLYVCLFQ